MVDNLTPVYKYPATPWRHGVYQTDLRGKTTYQHWNGKFWGLYGHTVESAITGRNLKSRFQLVDWRGLKRGK